MSPRDNIVEFIDLLMKDSPFDAISRHWNHFRDRAKNRLGIFTPASSAMSGKTPYHCIVGRHNDTVLCDETPVSWSAPVAFRVSLNTLLFIRDGAECGAPSREARTIDSAFERLQYALQPLADNALLASVLGSADERRALAQRIARDTPATVSEAEDALLRHYDDERAARADIAMSCAFRRW